MKPWRLWILIGAVVLFGFLLGRDQLALAAWYKLKSPAIAFGLNRNNVGLWMILGNYYFNGGAYDLARSQWAFEKALRLDPGIPMAHYQLGRIYFIKGELDTATEEIQKELLLHPEIPNSHYVLGLIQGYSGDFEEAEKDFQVFIERVPEQWAGYNDLAWIQVKLGKFQKAQNTVSIAFERLPGEKVRNPWLWTSLGVARLNLKEYNKAKDAFETALGIASRMSAQYFWSAYPGNDPRTAEDAFGQFKATLHFNLGIVHEKLNEWEAAKFEYNNYLAFLPVRAAGSFPQRDEVEKKIIELNARSK